MQPEIEVGRNERSDPHPKLGSVDDVSDPQADGCDQSEADVAVGGPVGTARLTEVPKLT